jgi:predicted nucleic acid-binding protein
MATYLLDTNILLRSVDDRSEHFELTLGVVRALLAKADVLCIVPQNLYEFWAVATRPASVNGLGWDTARVRQEVATLTESFALLPDTPRVFEAWLELVTLHAVQGKQVHDARLVAAMQAHSVDRLLTLNTEDFKRYPEIAPVHPGEVSTTSE